MWIYKETFKMLLIQNKNDSHFCLISDINILLNESFINLKPLYCLKCMYWFTDTKNKNGKITKSKEQKLNEHKNVCYQIGEDESRIVKMPTDEIRLLILKIIINL